MINPVQVKFLSDGKRILVVPDIDLYKSNDWICCSQKAKQTTEGGKFYLTCDFCKLRFEVRQRYGPYSCWNCGKQGAIDELCKPSQNIFPKFGYQCRYCGQDLQGWFMKKNLSNLEVLMGQQHVKLKDY